MCVSVCVCVCVCEQRDRERARERQSDRQRKKARKRERAERCRSEEYRTCFGPSTIGTMHSGSVACVDSSIKTYRNRCLLKRGSPAPTAVQQMTSAAMRSSCSAARRSVPVGDICESRSQTQSTYRRQYTLEGHKNVKTRGLTVSGST